MGKIILGVIVLVFLLVVVAIAIYLGHIAVYGYRQTLDESWQWQQEHVRQSRTYRRGGRFLCLRCQGRFGEISVALPCAHNPPFCREHFL